MVRHNSLAEQDLDAAFATDTGDLKQPIDHWLTVLSRLLHLPESTRQAVCAELREHLHERCRDLTLAGTPAEEAIRVAIAELGETAALARKFEHANRPPHRRLLMNLSLIGLGAGIVVLSAVALTPRTTQMSAMVFQQQENPTPEALKSRKTPLEIKNTAFDESVRFLAKSADLPVHFRQDELASAGIEIQAPITLSMTAVPISRALDLIVAEVPHANPDDPAEWRFEDGVLEIGTRRGFDRRDTVLVSHDITKVIDFITNSYNKSYDDAVSDITLLLTTMVEPNDWRQNGGDLGNIQVVGGTMFIQAPKRMQTRSQWILEQLLASSNPEKHAAAQTPQVPVLSDIPLISSFFTARRTATDPVIAPGTTPATSDPVRP